MKNFLFLLVPFVAYQSIAQNPEAKRTNIWYFGNGAGLDFSSGSPVPITDGALHSYEGGGSICDLEGNLLFYTDGDTVWTKLHQPMPNGTGLMGCGNYGSSAQNGLIIPKPGSETLYYIFTNDCLENFCEAGLRYSVVDMSLNGGLGDVTEKNILMLQPSTEALAATKHANGVDYWVMGHEYNSNRFFCYLLSQNGVSNEPVISEIGFDVTDYIISIQFSHKGDLLAKAQGVIGFDDQLFQFDKINGELHDLINMNGLLKGVGSGSAYTVVFSEDDSKIYFMRSGNYVYQYCLSVDYNEESISETATVIFQHLDNSAFGQFQLGQDGKIYISSVFNDSLSTIKFPNLYGNACGFQARNFFLGGKESQLGLPSFVSSFLYNSDIVPEDCDTIAHVGGHFLTHEILVFPNPTNDLLNIVIGDSTSAAVMLFNSIGQLVSAYQFVGKEHQMDVSRHSSGLYHLVVQTPLKEFIQKTIMIQKN